MKTHTFADAFGSGISWMARALPHRISAAAGSRDSAGPTEVLLTAGEELLVKARRKRQAVTMVVFAFNDLQELRSVFGNTVVRKLVAALTRKLQLLASAKGLATRTGPSMFAVLIPGRNAEKTLAAIRSTLGHPCCIELETGGDEIVLLPEFAVQALRPGSLSIAQAYELLCLELARAHLARQRREKYLQRERESHTRSRTPASAIAR
jgi:GGDEF domain-containing protein